MSRGRSRDHHARCAAGRGERERRVGGLHGATDAFIAYNTIPLLLCVNTVVRRVTCKAYKLAKGREKSGSRQTTACRRCKLRDGLGTSPPRTRCTMAPLAQRRRSRTIPGTTPHTGRTGRSGSRGGARTRANSRRTGATRRRGRLPRHSGGMGAPVAAARSTRGRGKTGRKRRRSCAWRTMTEGALAGLQIGASPCSLPAASVTLDPSPRREPVPPKGAGFRLLGEWARQIGAGVACSRS